MANNRKSMPAATGVTAAWLVITVIFILELFAYAWCRMECVHIGYAIEEELGVRERQAAARKNLTIELAHLKSPGRIERLGRDLGLAPPVTEQIKVIP
ncbi:MAG: hypothetical protein ACOWWM_07400 [Desulfobacterales bacterium]